MLTDAKQTHKGFLMILKAHTKCFQALGSLLCLVFAFQMMLSHVEHVGLIGLSDHAEHSHHAEHSSNENHDLPHSHDGHTHPLAVLGTSASQTPDAPSVKQAFPHRNDRCPDGPTHPIDQPPRLT